MRTGRPFDDVLVAARSGAAWAFEELYRELAPVVTGYLRLHGAAEPDDLASETFIGVFTGIGGFTGDEAALRAWVFTIAHRRLVDELRRRDRRPETLVDAVRPQIGGDVEEDAHASLEDAQVRAAIAELPEDQRAGLLLRIVGDLTIDQIAEALGKRPGAVKALQRRALRRMERAYPFVALQR